MGQLLTRAESWPVMMADGVDDTAAAPVAAAALASPPAATALAPPAPSPPPSLLPHPPSTADDGTPSLDGDVQLLIQDMVRHRVKQNWPFVRAFECRTSSEATASFPLKVGEWVIFSSSDRDETLLVGKVLKLGVAERYERQLDYWGPHKLLEVSLECLAQPTLSDGRLGPAAHGTCALALYWQLGSPWSQWSSYHSHGLLACAVLLDAVVLAQHM